MHKSWQVLYQCRAFIPNSEVLLSLGLFNKPNIFVSTKYFFLWPFQVYYWRRGEYFHVFLLNSVGSHLSLLKDPVVTSLHGNSSPMGGCWPSALPAAGTSPYQPAAPGQHPEPATVPVEVRGCLQRLCLSAQKSKAVPQSCESWGV